MGDTPVAVKPEGDGGDGQPKYITEEQLNKALGGYRNRIKGDMQKMLDSFAEKVTGVVGKSDDVGDEGIDDAEPKPEPKKAAPADGKIAPDVERRIRAAERRAENAEKTAREEKERREAIDAKVRKDEERDALRVAFKAGGVRDGLIDDLVESKMAKGHVVRDPDDDGKLLWRRGKDDDVELASGVTEFLKSPSGKEYLPAKGQQGSGQTSGGGRVVNGKSEPGGLSDEEFINGVL